MSRDESQNQSRKHIMVVNGDPYFLELIRELLQDHQYNVTTTNFVPETFKQVEALQPNLIVIDLAIGERGGWDLLERMQQEAVTREIPIIVTSTDPRFLDTARNNQERYGENKYIAKPMDLMELRNTIEEFASKT